jgi:hypothetical protein
MLPCCNIGDQCAVVHQVLRILAIQTPVHHHTEFVNDSLQNVEPMKLGMHEPRQASVEFTYIQRYSLLEVQKEVLTIILATIFVFCLSVGLGSISIGTATHENPNLAAKILTVTYVQPKNQSLHICPKTVATTTNASLFIHLGP